MISLCLAWMLTFKISGDDTPPVADIGTLGAPCRCRPPDMVVIVIFVLLPLSNMSGHKIRGVVDILENPLVMYN